MPGSQRDEREWQTRRNRIDPRLAAAGWAVKPFTADLPFGLGTNVALTEYETENGPADYALCVDGSVLAVVEAERVTLGPQGVLAKAFYRGLVPTDAYLAATDAIGGRA